MSNRKKIHFLLQLSAGSVLMLVSVLADYIRGFSFYLGPVQSAILVVGLVIILIGFIAQTGSVARTSANLCLFILSIIIIFSLLEGFFRLVAFDFAREEEAWRKIPPYYRKPILPTGEAFFRRPGPEQWTGQVLNTRLEQLNISPNPYRDEPVIRVKYDKLGFRNEDGLSDWEVAVAGDSFTELGYLAYDQLFTTILGKIMNVRVLNLGTSYTGPLTQLSYLQDYGISPSTKYAIIVFFEGNDLDDLRREYAALVRYRGTGQREYREFKKQTSMLRALFRLRYTLRPQKTPHDPVTAYFKSAHGDIPITLDYPPQNKAQISAESMHQLEYFFRRYAAFAQGWRIKAWLVYMPCKLRVVHGQIEFSESAPEELRKWEPTDFPQVISALSDQYGVEFIDLTPALMEETKSSRELVFNSIYETHLNSLGSMVVARTIARHLSAQDSLSPNALQPTR